MSAKRSLHKLFQRAARNVKAVADRDKGPKEADRFEVWHHHGSLRSPSEFALLLRFDQRR